ncbi:MAG TPA: zinc ribbon domain-containing protein [Solirubrobacteraceae bacterium]
MSGRDPSEAPEQERDGDQAAEGAGPEQPGFGSRGKARRRARFLRRARELAYRDLGGLVYSLHRYGQRNDALVLAKLATLAHIDTELRTIEAALRERRPVTVLREAGITACPRCAAIHGSEDRFCPNCGLPMARNVDLPIAGAPAGAPEPPGAGPQPQPPPAAPVSSTPPASAGVAYAAQPPAPAPAPTAMGAGAPAAPPAPPAAEAHVPPLPPQAPQAAPAERQPSTAPPPDAGAPRAPRPPSVAAEEATEIVHPQPPGA